MSWRYVDLCKKYLREGEKLLNKGDYVQASEKFWGAVIEVIKAIAEKRGWDHHRHRDLAVAVDKLFLETKDRELLRLFGSAESLHANFYENFASPETVKAYVEDTKGLIEKLEKLI